MLSEGLHWNCVQDVFYGKPNVHGHVCMGPGMCAWGQAAMCAWNQACVHGTRHVCMGPGMCAWGQPCVHGASHVCMGPASQELYPVGQVCAHGSFAGPMHKHLPHWVHNLWLVRSYIASICGLQDPMGQVCCTQAWGQVCVDLSSRS